MKKLLLLIAVLACFNLFGMEKNDENVHASETWAELDQVLTYLDDTMGSLEGLLGFDELSQRLDIEEGDIANMRTKDEETEKEHSPTDYPFMPRDDKDNSVEIMNTLVIDDATQSFFDGLDPLLESNKDQPDNKVQNLVSNYIFNFYKNKPNYIVRLLNLANIFKNFEDEKKKLGELLKKGCIEFIADTAFRKSKLGSHNAARKGEKLIWYHNIAEDLWDSLYYGDNYSNFAKKFLAEQNSNCMRWIESLKLSDEDSELVASSIFEKNRRYENKKRYYKGGDLSCQVLRYADNGSTIALLFKDGILLENNDRYYPYLFSDDFCSKTKPTAVRFMQNDALLAVANVKNNSIGIYDPSKSESSYRRFYWRTLLSETREDKERCVKKIKTQVLLEGHSDTVSSLDVHRDGKHALSGSYDKTWRLWDVETGKSSVMNFSYPIKDVQYSPANPHVFVAGGEKTKVFDNRLSGRNPTLKLEDGALTVDQSADGSQLLIAGRRVGEHTYLSPFGWAKGITGICIYDVVAGKYRHESYVEGIQEARFSPNSGEKFFIRSNNNVRIIALDDDWLHLDKRALNPNRDFITTACSYSPDGKKLAKIGYFALMSSRNPSWFSQGTTLIEYKLEDPSKRELGKGLSAARALGICYNEKVTEQAQSKFVPKGY